MLIYVLDINGQPLMPTSRCGKVRRLLKTKSQMINLLSLHTGQKEEKIKNDIERDYYMTPEDALEYNLIDEIILKEKQA